MKKFSNDNYQLTERENDFIKRFLADNGCGANSPEESLPSNLNFRWK